MILLECNSTKLESHIKQMSHRVMKICGTKENGCFPPEYFYVLIIYPGWLFRWKISIKWIEMRKQSLCVMYQEVLTCLKVGIRWFLQKLKTPVFLDFNIIKMTTLVRIFWSMPFGNSFPILKKQFRTLQVSDPRGKDWQVSAAPAWVGLRDSWIQCCWHWGPCSIS